MNLSTAIKALISIIYQWYAEDFGSQDELLDHLIHYRPELANDERIKRRFRYEYDWQLNRK